jgi:hypothetical protein
MAREYPEAWISPSGTIQLVIAPIAQFAIDNVKFAIAFMPFASAKRTCLSGILS